MLRPQFPQLQIYPDLGQQNRLGFLLVMLIPQGHWFPHQPGNPLRTGTLSSLLSCLLTPSGIPSQEVGSRTERTLDWESLNACVMLPKPCLLAQSVFWQGLFPS